MLEAMIVRRARPEDVERVHQVHTGAIRGGAGNHYPPEVVDVWVDAFNPANFSRNIQRMEFFVAELPAGRIAGFLALDLETRELDSLYVAPWANGFGLGSYFLGFAEEIARQAGLEDLWLDASLNAVSFYSRYGWEEIGRHARIRKGVEIPVMRMEKQLTP
ncbi:MAG: GNAT family N-acetyltransferase [Longimicrobiales bacterium]